MKPLVYVAGPYTHPDPIANTHRAVKVGMAIWDTGLAAVTIPHVTMVSHLVAPRPVEDWYRFDLDLLEHCDAVYRMPGASTGADREVAHAVALGLPVHHGPADDHLDDCAHGWLRALSSLCERGAV